MLLIAVAQERLLPPIPVVPPGYIRFDTNTRSVWEYGNSLQFPSFPIDCRQYFHDQSHTISLARCAMEFLSTHRSFANRPIQDYIPPDVRQSHCHIRIPHSEYPDSENPVALLHLRCILRYHLSYLFSHPLTDVALLQWLRDVTDRADESNQPFSLIGDVPLSSPPVQKKRLRYTCSTPR